METLTTAKKPQKRKYRAFAWKNGKKTAEIYEGDELLEMLNIAKDPSVVYFTLSVLDRPARR